MSNGLQQWVAVAALLLASVPAAGQGRSPSPGSQTPASKGNEVTLIGCVEAEKDYRARLDATKGGPLASGLGQGNEYVLSAAKPAPASGAELTKKEAVATSGQSGDYLLTGKPETELSKAIGRQVEIVGVVEPFKANDSGSDARDRLPRLTIATWHPVGDFCPAAKK